MPAPQKTSTSSEIRKLAAAVQLEHSAVTVVVEDGKVLLLQRGGTAPWMPLAWNLPGGGVDAGETPQQGAVRELVEEAGIRPGRLRKLRSINMGPELGILHPFVSEGYRGKPRLTDHENIAIAWVGVDDLKRYKMVPFIERIIRNVLSA